MVQPYVLNRDALISGDSLTDFKVRVLGYDSGENENPPFGLNGNFGDGISL